MEWGTAVNTGFSNSPPQQAWLSSGTDAQWGWGMGKKDGKEPSARAKAWAQCVQGPGPTLNTKSSQDRGPQTESFPSFPLLLPATGWLGALLGVLGATQIWPLV